MPEGIKPVSILIVEDDLSFALELEMLVQAIGYDVAGVVDNAGQALELIYSDRVDFILMDIDIKGRMTGLELGRKIQPLKIPILFITSFRDDAHYEGAQKSNIAGYLVKPIDKYTLQTAITLAVGQLFSSQEGSKPGQSTDEFRLGEHLFLKKDGVYHKVAERDIVLVEGAGDYIHIHLQDGRIFALRKTLKLMERILPEALFVRVHRRYLANMSAIDFIDLQASQIKVAGNLIPVSRQYRGALEKLIRRLE